MFKPKNKTKEEPAEDTQEDVSKVDKSGDMEKDVKAAKEDSTDTVDIPESFQQEIADLVKRYAGNKACCRYACQKFSDAEINSSKKEAPEEFSTVGMPSD